MTKNKEHLKINLDFLDKEEITKPPVYNHENVQNSSASKNNNNIQSGSKYKWKNILIVVGIILFLIWAIFSEDSNNSNSTTNNYSTTPNKQSTYDGDDRSVVVGEYRCSQYNYNKSINLEPDENKRDIDFAESELQNNLNVIDNLENEINNSSVTDYSDQWEIDEYNSMVDEYNLKLSKYKSDYTDLDLRIEKFNTQVEKHNNFLINNCTKIK